MSARRMPCKRCHHPKPVGPDGYCTPCAGILAGMKRPKSMPPVDGEDAQSVVEPASPPAAAGDSAETAGGDTGSAGGESEPVTERSSKTPTLPPITGVSDKPAPIDYATIEGRTAAFAGEFGALGPTASMGPSVQDVPPIPGFAPTMADAETATYVAKNGDPDLAVLVSPLAPVPPSLMGVEVNIAAHHLEHQNQEGPSVDAQLRDIGKQITDAAEARNHVEFDQLGTHIDSLFDGMSKLASTKD